MAVQNNRSPKPEFPKPPSPEEKPGRVERLLALYLAHSVQGNRGYPVPCIAPCRILFDDKKAQEVCEVGCETVRLFKKLVT